MVKYYVDPMVKTDNNEYEKIVFNSSNEYQGGFVYTLTHHKTGTVHYLKGFPIIEKEDNTQLFIGQFRATDAYSKGDTFILVDSSDNITNVVVNAVPLSTDTELFDNTFIKNDLVSITIDSINKKIGFNISAQKKNTISEYTYNFSDNTHFLIGSGNNVQFTPTKDYVETNIIQVNGISVTPIDNLGETLDEPFKANIVQNATLQGDKLVFKMGGSGVNETLPPQIRNLKAIAGNKNITLTWDLPIDTQHYLGLTFVRKDGSPPLNIKDGQKIVLDNLLTKYTDNNLSVGIDYYYRAFPMNNKKQYQTDIIGAIVSAVPLDYVTPYTLEPLSVPRHYTTSSPLANGVIVSGGASSSLGYVDTSDYYDSNKVRSTLTPLSEARYKLMSSPLANGVIVAGGTGLTLPLNTVDYYDSNKVRSTLTPLSEARGLATSSPLANGSIVSGGGIDENNTTFSGTVDYYDSNKVRSTLTPLSEARASLSSSPLTDGVAILGGEKNKIALSTVDYYDSNKVRSTLTPLSQPMSHATSTILADGIVIFNGIKEFPVVNFYNKDKIRTTLQPLSVGSYAPTSSPLADGAVLLGQNSVEFYPTGSTIPQT